MQKMYLFLFDILAIATNGKPLLKRSSSILPVLQRFCLLSGLPMATVVPVPRSIYLNDDPYRCDSATIMMSSFGQTEQGAHEIRKSLIYSTRKAFLERAVVELVYKFNEKSTVSV